ncbi:MAG: hypothetical protein AAGH15_06285 [Myxococcota bacterium]
MALALLFSVVSFAGCGDDDGPDSSSDPMTDAGSSADTGTADMGTNPDPDAGVDLPPVYAIHFTQQTPDTFNSLIGTVSTLDGSEAFDVSTALEFPGFLGVTAPTEYDGSFYVALGDETVIIRYDVTDEGDLVEFDRLNYGSLGATSGNFMLRFAHFISPERAYLVVPDALSVLIWNPQTMRIVDSVDLTEGIAPPEGLLTRFTDSRIDDAGRLLVPVGYCRPSPDFTCAPLMRLAIIEPETFAVTYDEDTRCGRPTLSVTDGDGAAYFISHPGQSSQFVGEAAGDPAFPGCMIRVLAGADGFDSEYYLDKLSLTPEGRPIGSVVPATGNLVYATVWPRSPDEFDAENWFTLRSEPVWEVFAFEPGNEAATFMLQADVPATADQISGGQVLIDVDGTDVMTPLALTNPEGFGSTTLFDVSDPADWSEGITVPGFAYSVTRVR